MLPTNELSAPDFEANLPEDVYYYPHTEDDEEDAA